jgi:hypothetical protein
MDQRRFNLDPRPSGLPTVLEVIDRTHHGGGSGAATATQTPSMGEESLSGMDSSPRPGRNEHAGSSGAGGANRRSDWDWSAGLRARSTPPTPLTPLSPFILHHPKDYLPYSIANPGSPRHLLTTRCGLGGPRSGRSFHAGLLGDFAAEAERAHREVGGGWREQAERLERGCVEIACRLQMGCTLT